MSRYTIAFRDGMADRAGIDDGGSFRCQVIAQRGDYLALKIPGGKFWSSRGSQGYASPCVEVYLITERLDANTVRAETILDWDAGRKKR